MNPGTCKSCGARVIWCHTESGKRMPLDEEPSERGNMLLGKDGVARHIGDPAMFAGQKRLSHFATCASAAQHRKGKK